MSKQACETSSKPEDQPIAWLGKGEGALELWQPLYVVSVDKEGVEEEISRQALGWNPYRVFPVYTHPTETWQPIASAPKDGTRILICGGTYYRDSDGDEYPMLFVDIASWCHSGWQMGYASEYDVMYYAIPTHFQPLPAPPRA